MAVILLTFYGTIFVVSLVLGSDQTFGATETAEQVEGSIQVGQDAGVVAQSMGGSMEEQLQMPAAANKITVPLKKHHPNLHMAHAGAGKGGGEAPAVMVTAPKASSQAPKHAHLLASPRACLCSPTTHAGSFRCRLHRGGAGLHEMGKKTSPGA